MTFENIKQLIERGESRTLELKKSTGELKDAMHSACAMLNGSGAKRIIDACKEQNVQEPTWEINDSSVKVVFVRKYSESIIYEDNTTNKTTNKPTTNLQQKNIRQRLKRFL